MRLQLVIDGPDATTHVFETPAQKDPAYQGCATESTDNYQLHQTDTVWRCPLSEHTYQAVISDFEGSGL